MVSKLEKKIIDENFHLNAGLVQFLTIDKGMILKIKNDPNNNKVAELIWGIIYAPMNDIYKGDPQFKIRILKYDNFKLTKEILENDELRTEFYFKKIKALAYLICGTETKDAINRKSADWNARRCEVNAADILTSLTYDFGAFTKYTSENDVFYISVPNINDDSPFGEIDAFLIYQLRIKKIGDDTQLYVSIDSVIRRSPRYLLSLMPNINNSKSYKTDSMLTLYSFILYYGYIGEMVCREVYYSKMIQNPHTFSAVAKCKRNSIFSKLLNRFILRKPYDIIHSNFVKKYASIELCDEEIRHYIDIITHDFVLDVSTNARLREKYKFEYNYIMNLTFYDETPVNYTDFDTSQ